MVLHATNSCRARTSVRAPLAWHPRRRSRRGGDARNDVLAHARSRRGGRAPARERPRVDTRETSSSWTRRPRSSHLRAARRRRRDRADLRVRRRVRKHRGRARAGGAAGAVVTSTSALGSATPRDSAVDPMEASGARPMSAYGTIDEHSPVMRALGEDPVEAAAAAFLDDATLGERERPGPDASSDAARTAPRTDPSRRCASSAASVQADVDSQIEIEMRRLDEAARAMDAERARRDARATSGPPPRPSRPDPPAADRTRRSSRAANAPPPLKRLFKGSEMKTLPLAMTRPPRRNINDAPRGTRRTRNRDSKNAKNAN